MKERCLPVILYKGFAARDGTAVALPLHETGIAAMGADAAKASFAPVVVAGECTSTFDLAWELAKESDMPPWSAVLALSQTGGRGQLRRKWVSPPGNVYVSFFLPSDMGGFGNLASLATGYLVHAALLSLGIVTKLKWPNDMLLSEGTGEGKFGGLLLEEREGRLMAGLGLNLRTAPETESMRPDRAVSAVALPSFAGKVFPFWLDLASGMRAVHAGSITGASPKAVRMKVEESLAWKGRAVRAEDGGVIGELAGLTDDGSLILRTDTGLTVIASGSIIPVRG